MKRTIEVTIVREIEVEFMPKMFDVLPQAEYVAEFNKFFGTKDQTIDDIFKYAARSVALGGAGEYEGLGKVGAYYLNDTSVLDVKFNELSELIDEEFTDGGAA